MTFQLPNYSNMGGYTPFDESLAGPPNGGFSTPTFGSTGAASGAGSAGGAQPGWFGIKGLGANMDTAKLGMNGLQTLAGLWAGIQQLKLARQSVALTRSTTNANLANQTQSYNTSIQDRARARGAVEGQSSAEVTDYIAQNSLAKRTV
jgi:hypothetical protein